MTEGDLAATLPPVLVLARVVHFASTAVLWGGGGLLCCLRASAGGRDAPRVLSLLRVAAGLAALSGAAWIAATLVTVTGDPVSLADAGDWAAFFSSAFGPPWAIHLALLAGCAALAFVPGHRALAASTLLAASLAVDQAWLGHGASGPAGPAGWVMRMSYAFHILAAYAWTGALPALALLLVKPAEPDLGVRALRLFSTVGLLAVATILATGVTNASFRVGSLSGLLTTSYGRILAVKVALFTAMLLLAGLNRSMAGRDGAGSAGAAQRHPAPPRHLIGSVAAETGLGLLVLGAAAVLGITAPPS